MEQIFDCIEILQLSEHYYSMDLDSNSDTENESTEVRIIPCYCYQGISGSEIMKYLSLYSQDINYQSITIIIDIHL